MIKKTKVLCLPAGMPRSLEYLRAVDQETVEVVGASSEKFDVSRQAYSDWLYMPHITDPSFAQEFISRIEERKIKQVYTPHQVIWNYIDELIRKHGLDLSLVNSQPILTELQPYQQCLQDGRDIIEGRMDIAAATTGRETLLPVQYASLIRHARLIPGETDEQKIVALCEIMRYCPQGDIVEIGTLWGKSAFVLTFLANHHKTGPVLCIDPWDKDYLPQGSALLQKYSSDTHDISAALSVFQMNVLPYACGNINYLHLPSDQAHSRYRSDHCVSSEAFGATRFSGSIALLHIDGNHAYEYAVQDLALWQQHVCAGGWVVMDDYCWKFGDGPQRAVDEFISDHAERVQCAFVMGGALFFQFRT